MNFSLEKITILSKIIFTIVLSFFIGRMAGSFINVQLSTVDSSKKVKKIHSKKKRQIIKEQNPLDTYSNILAKNIFDSNNDIPEDEIKETISEESTDATRRSSLGIELIGTIVVNDPNRSVAAIKIKNKKTIEPFSVGEIILNTAIIASIQRKKVILKNTKTGNLEYIMMGKESDKSTTQSRGGVRMVSDDHVIIEKGEVNRALNNINDLLMQARALPYTEDGKITGFRLLSIKSGSLYQKLGAKNGDIIRSVNGMEVNSPAVAMQLYKQLRNGKEFNIGITRGGEDISFKVEIR